jgi:hypothetical protein
MKRTALLQHEFVRAIPDQLKDGTLYISVDYATATHRCCCGCGREVVTPLSPTDWKLTYDGMSISLYPSVGNWSFACKSHYWIDRSRVVWAERWSEQEIAAGRARDRLAKTSYYAGQESAMTKAAAGIRKPADDGPKWDFWSWLTSWFSKER